MQAEATAEVTVLKSPASTTLDELARLAAEPLRRAGAERAVVFGSYARGTADGYSDLDLVVVLSTDRPPTERWPLLRELLDALPVSVDLLVYTPEEFARGMERRVGIFDAIAREGWFSMRDPQAEGRRWLTAAREESAEEMSGAEAPGVKQR